MRDPKEYHKLVAEFERKAYKGVRGTLEHVIEKSENCLHKALNSIYDGERADATDSLAHYFADGLFEIADKHVLPASNVLPWIDSNYGNAINAGVHDFLECGFASARTAAGHVTLEVLPLTDRFGAMIGVYECAIANNLMRVPTCFNVSFTEYTGLPRTTASVKRKKIEIEIKR